MKHKKSLALLASAAMTISSVAPAFTSVAMAEGTVKYKDDTYKVTKTVMPDAKNQFQQYELEVSFTVTDGLVAEIEAKQVTETDESEDNLSYISKALDGTEKSTGLRQQIIGKQSAEGLDAVSRATCASNAIIDAAKDALERAKITETPDTTTVDKIALQTAVDTVNAAGYVESNYTAESWAAFQTALTAANDVLANENATQDDVVAAKNALDNAVAALKAPAAPTVDKTKLEEAIAAAPTEQGTYTAESWEAYQTALKNAKGVFADVTATQDKVNAAYKALTDARNALAEKQPEAGKDVYVLMNIPYDDFYKAELNGNNVKVDGVTSATKNKTRTGSLVGGSYHVNEDGTDITGVIYPVKIDSAALEKFKKITDDDKLDITVTNRGQTSTTTYEGKDALFGSESYAYYLLSEAPAAYKEVSVGEDGSLNFGEIQTSNVTKLSDARAELKTSTKYGDYQINVDGLPKDLGNVSAVILETKKGDSYGLRHLENIWRQSELAFSTGFTTEVHGCPVSGEHYKSIMGKTITKITYVTQNGEYTIDTKLYVPIKTGITATAKGTEGTGTAEVMFSKDLPANFAPVYTAEGIEIKAEGNTLQYENAKPGKYTVTVSDSNGEYADISAELTVQSKATGRDFVKIENGSSKLTGAVAIADYVKNITSVTVNDKIYSATGRGATKLFFDNGYLDITAAPFAGSTVALTDADSTSFKAGATYNITIQADGYPDATLTYTVPDTIYAYANLSYGEYWAKEDVQAAGNTASSEEKDHPRNEPDKGAFDAVSRATTNHGLHRGSFQQSAVIHTDAGKDFAISHWNDANTIVLIDGSTITYKKGIITYTEGRTQKTANQTSYEITGIKYVPVAVSANDFAAFLANRGANYVVVNGGALAGGYGENKLGAYTATANVTANTNGLKTAVKNADGSFSFSKRSTGADSGLIGSSLQTADNNNITVTVKPAGGSYGEFLRVDLTGDGYGALGSKMQTVEWTYYGSDSTYTTPVAHYGTKFAADNWMHKSMGIQLGLTDSIRCTLPAGTDGTGYWALTVRALGYEDYTVKFQATDENIVKDQVTVKGDFTALKELAAKASEKKESDYTAESWAQFKAELDETDEMIAANTATQAMINEQITHLRNAMDNLKTVPGNFDASKKLVKQAGEKQEGDYTAESWAAFQAELGKLNAMIAAGTAPQSEINAQYIALENAMKALTKKSSSGSSHSSSSSSSSSSTTNHTTNNTTTNNTTVQAAPVSAAGTSPKTGDPTSLFGWMAAGLGSIGGLGALIRKRRK